MSRRSARKRRGRGGKLLRPLTGVVGCRHCRAFPLGPQDRKEAQAGFSLSLALGRSSHTVLPGFLTKKKCLLYYTTFIQINSCICTKNSCF